MKNNGQLLLCRNSAVAIKVILQIQESFSEQLKLRNVVVGFSPHVKNILNLLDTIQQCWHVCKAIYGFKHNYTLEQCINSFMWEENQKLLKQSYLLQKSMFSLICANFLCKTLWEEDYNSFLFLSEKQYAQIVGHLLGDGNLSSRTKEAVSARFKFSQTLSIEQDVQKDSYVQNVLNLFQNYIRSESPHARKILYNRKEFWRLDINTVESPIFAPIFRNWYQKILVPTGRSRFLKKLPLDFCTQKRSAQSLAVWFMDDGVKVKTGGPIFCTDSFTLLEIQSLQHILKQSFDLESTIYYHNGGKGKTYPRLRINGKQNTIKFINIVKPYIHVQRLDKLPIA
jgi:hypothetical protein